MHGNTKTLPSFRPLSLSLSLSRFISSSLFRLVPYLSTSYIYIYMYKHTCCKPVFPSHDPLSLSPLPALSMSSRSKPISTRRGLHRQYNRHYQLEAVHLQPTAAAAASSATATASRAQRTKPKGATLKLENMCNMFHEFLQLFEVLSGTHTTCKSFAASPIKSSFGAKACKTTLLR